MKNDECKMQSAETEMTGCLPRDRLAKLRLANAVFGYGLSRKASAQ